MQLRYQTRLILLLLFYALSIWPGYAQKYRQLPLQRPGQAAVAIDTAKQTAYILDLGKSGDGDRLEVEGRPLLQWIESEQVKHLVISCSHPHADHNGGIVALMKKPEVFFYDKAMTQPRFDRITFIDDSVVPSLYDSLRTRLLKNPHLNVKHIKAAGINAYAEISKPGDAVFIENIPYTATAKAGTHGRSLVTRIVLADGHTHIDFDDADSAVIAKAAQALRARGTTRLDSFVVPHHGSAVHNIEPILSLNPGKAVITVNPENPYEHPAPKILLSLIERLGPRNVLFTGSKDYIGFGPGGLEHASFTAADTESYLLFVRPNLKRAIEKKKLTPDLAKTYKAIYDSFYAEPKVAVPRATLAGTPPPKPVLADASIATLIKQVEATGTFLTSDFEIARIGPGGADLASIAKEKVFSARPKPESRPFVGVSAKSAPSPKAALGKLAMTSNPTGDEPVEIRMESAPGVEDGIAAPDIATVNELQKRSAQKAPVGAVQPVRDGGMVNLTGDKVFTAQSAKSISGGTLEMCQTQLCVKAGGTGPASYTLPFSPNSLFWEVWDRVVNREIDTFYLSINPTRQYLKTPESFEIPASRMNFGVGTPATAAANKVVTEGDIGHSEIGRILWEADVEFKSESLGLNVLTGTRKTVTTSTSLIDAPPAPMRQALLDSKKRWCRLYWASGSQTIQLDTVTRRVSLVGGAVIARAEGMVLVDGSLQDFPNAAWCADAKSVAARLEAEAKGLTPRPVLRELRRVAEIQNFARWARDHNVVMSDALTQRLRALPSATYEVPQWTSGIRSTPDVVFLPARNTSRRGVSLTIHYTGAGDPALEQCIEKEWPTKDDMEKAGCTMGPSGFWENCDDKFEAVWNGLPIRAAACATETPRLSGRVKVRPAYTAGTESAQSRLNLLLGNRREKTLELVPHFSSVEVHGGVALDSRRKFLENAWRHEGIVTLPNGGTIFRQIGNDLHFWSSIDTDAEHVVIDGAQVLGAHAEGGRLRFVVKADASATVRHELRAKQTHIFPLGLEWAEMREAADGSLLLQKAVWPCGPDCIGAADLSFSELGEYVDLFEPLIGVEKRSDGIWAIEVSLETIRREFDKERENTDCTSEQRCLALARNYSRWGFLDEALDLYTELLDVSSPETEDTILEGMLRHGYGLDPFEIETMAEFFEVHERLEARVREGTLLIPDALSELRRMETKIATVSPESRADLWALLGMTCETLAKTAAPDQKAGVRRTADRYNDLAKQAEYLIDPISNPWD